MVVVVVVGVVVVLVVVGARWFWFDDAAARGSCVIVVESLGRRRSIMASEVYIPLVWGTSCIVKVNEEVKAEMKTVG